MKKEPFSPSVWAVLHFLLQHSEKELIDAEIASEIDSIKKSSVHIALKKLAEMNILTRTPRGRMILNKLNDTAYVNQLKIMSNLIEVEELMEKIKPFCEKIILFGSRANGSNTSESDFDLFCISTKPEKIRKIIANSSIAESTQLILKTPEEMLSFSDDEPVLNDEIKKGITIWERE
ncbi:MAG: nucleotidyltransferase domain-containing protein [Pseudomonadota bacterium]